ncbi:MAG: hypothetical protein ACMG51_06825 [Ginsengibacter sp.]
MTIAIDYDGVCSDLSIQTLAKKMIRERNEVWIVTMRSDNEFNNKILEPVLKRLNLTKYNVIYCDNKPKLEMLEMLNADIYIDNVNNEFANISRQTNIIPLLFSNS